MKDRIVNILKNHGKGYISQREIGEKLGLGAEEKAGFRLALRELLEEEVLLQVKKHYFAIRERSGLITGTLQCNRSGFGFVIPDTQPAPAGDIYIRAANLGEAIHGDRVVVELVEGTPRFRGRGAEPAREPARREGRIVRVLERGIRRIIGKIIFLKRPVVIPLDSRFHYSVTVTNAAGFDLQDQDVVCVNLTSDPAPGSRPEGVISALVGRPGDPELPLLIAMHKHDIPREFPPEVLAEAAAAADRMPSGMVEAREDFRGRPIVTIDGETAHDFDDAVDVVRNADGSYKLGVHIADVSFFVEPRTLLDAEALKRGTSVYFPDRAVPMLPAVLSSGVCSLLPDQDRLCLSALLTIDGKTGQTTQVRFTPSLIRSRARLTYTQVAAALQGEESARQSVGDVFPELERMVDLFNLLNRRRRERGAIDFDLPQEEVRYDEAQNVIGIYRAERTVAHRLIEEFMLAANEAVAGRFQRLDLPFLYRIHEPPDGVKVQEFAEIAARFGYGFPVKEEGYTPADFQQLASSFEDSPAGRYLCYLMLRSFKLAIYSHRNAGHFGLASDAYTHFTSPIRRYPDLMVHRLLRQLLLNDPFRDKSPLYLAPLEELAKQSSDRERAAMEAEREILAWKKAQFMEERLGDEFEGFVSSLRPNGIGVELFDFFIEGFVPFSLLTDDYYQLDEQRHILVGEHTGRIFRLGTRVRVRVDAVDMDRYQITLAVAGMTGDQPEARPERAALRKAMATRAGKVKGRRRKREAAAGDTEVRPPRGRRSRKDSRPAGAGGKSTSAGRPPGLGKSAAASRSTRQEKTAVAGQPGARGDDAKSMDQPDRTGRRRPAPRTGTPGSGEERSVRSSRKNRREENRPRRGKKPADQAGQSVRGKRRADPGSENQAPGGRRRKKDVD